MLCTTEKCWCTKWVVRRVFVISPTYCCGIVHMTVILLNANVLLFVIYDIAGHIVMEFVCYRYSCAWIQDRSQHHSRAVTKPNNRNPRAWVSWPFICRKHSRRTTRDKQWQCGKAWQFPSVWCGSGEVKRQSLNCSLCMWSYVDSSNYNMIIPKWNITIMLNSVFDSSCDILTLNFIGLYLQLKPADNQRSADWEFVFILNAPMS